MRKIANRAKLLTQKRLNPRANIAGNLSSVRKDCQVARCHSATNFALSGLLLLTAPGFDIFRPPSRNRAAVKRCTYRVDC